MEDLALVFVIVVALAFDYTNGLNDAANSIATVVATRALSPRHAVIWAAFFNFIAFLIFEEDVAATIANDVVDQQVLSIAVIFAGLAGAIAWNVGALALGVPTSSSHALVGGIAGAAIAKAGFSAVVGSGISKIAVFIILSPLIGLALAFIVMSVVLQLSRGRRNVDRLNRRFGRLQLASAAAFSLGHGGQDAQKTMGVILALLIASGHLSPGSDVPLWVVLVAHAAIGLGTLAGGWRIVHTMGSKITKLQPVGGLAAESSAAATLFFVSGHGIPVSTTQTMAGAIVGVGSLQRLSAVRWGVAGRVVWTWVLTIPGAGAMAAGAFILIDVF